MKITHDPEKDFTPFNIRVETKEEALILWHRMNLLTSDVEKTMSDKRLSQYQILNVATIESIWQKLQEELKRQNISPF